MASVLIPVLLSMFLGPGMGQLYNGEYKKAAILIGIVLAIVLAGFWWYRQQLMVLMPPDLATMDPEALTAFATKSTQDIYAKHRSVLHGFVALLMTLQIYSIWDAFRVAQRKRGHA